ncbi:hypothetical protein AVW11_03790 [Streptomyces amritsarensis]|uniref:Uncharacterized protein n=1 Tax=Streptomyces amritsarensis TaxID=681158 RepID=A0ABX3GD21_9ACTN|nr:hypothetical protein [Streptomyces amritsarensis]OLZ72524.1 hypothetical protein AVW11_03790 [Streptomyces amritsarensis]
MPDIISGSPNDTNPAARPTLTEAAEQLLATPSLRMRLLDAARSLAQAVAGFKALGRKREAAERAARLQDGIRAENSHLLHDADTDAMTRPFPYMRKGTTARAASGRAA